MDLNIRERPASNIYFLAMAQLVSMRSTCVRRMVGVVITDQRNHVRATGYNGVPAGALHCSDGHFCPGAKLESGQGLDECYATHAEMNALLQVTDSNDLSKIYITVSPCVSCAKLICNSSIKEVIVGGLYPDYRSSFDQLRNAKKKVVVLEGLNIALKLPDIGPGMEYKPNFKRDL